MRSSEHLQRFVRQVGPGSALEPSSLALLRLSASLACLGVCSELHAGPADRSDLSLNWNAPEGCPQREAVLSQVRDLASDAYPGDPRLHVEGTVTQLERRRYLLELKLVDTEGVEVRRIEANACRELAGGAAVIIGLKLTREGGPAPQGASEDREPSGAPASEPLPQATPSPESDTQSPKAAPPAAVRKPQSRPAQSDDALTAPSEPGGRWPHDWWLALPEFGISVGALPTPMFALQATLGRRFGAWAIAASGRYSIARSVETDVVEIGARVQLHSAALSVIHGWRFGDFAVEPGLVVRAHYLAARGEGEDLDAASASTTVLQWGMDLNLRWELNETLALRSTLSAGVHADRPRFMIDALGEVRRLGAGQLAFSVGPELSF